MKIELELDKTVHQNANEYFLKAKKLKAKLEGMDFIVEKTKKEIENFEKNHKQHLEKKELKQKIETIKGKNWYDNFRHCFTRNGHLCVFGKDAGSNEVLLKKHMQTTDIVLHTSAPGSPFGIIKDAVKNDECVLSKEDIEDAAIMICAFSKQWKRGFGTADAFWVYPHQVSKKAESGEYIAKGAFMIRGKKNELKNLVVQIGLGVEKEQVNVEGDEKPLQIYHLISGSVEVIKKRCSQRYVKVEPGQDKYKTLGKEIKKRLDIGLEDLPKVLPNGSRILKRK